MLSTDTPLFEEGHIVQETKKRTRTALPGRSPLATTFHLAPKAFWEAADPGAPYLPEYYAAEGFIHCTDGVDNLTVTANRHYRQDPREFVVLVVDLDRVSARIVYEDKKHIYPHIYGALNRDAILRVLPVPRAADGEFLPVSA